MMFNLITSIVVFVLIGGFYSGSEALVRDECERCETGAHVSFVRAPGVDRQDCYTCPRGNRQENR